MFTFFPGIFGDFLCKENLSNLYALYTHTIITTSLISEYGKIISAYFLNLKKCGDFIGRVY